MKAFAQQTQPQTHQTQPAPVSLEETTLPTFPLLGAAFVLISAIVTVAIWVGQLREKIARTEADVNEISENLEKIQHSLEALNVRMEDGHKALRKDLIEEIRKEILRSEGNIDTSFQTPFLRLEMQIAHLTRELDQRNQTVNQLKQAVGRMGPEIREAKTLARYAWDLNCGASADNGPPSRPQRYQS